MYVFVTAQYERDYVCAEVAKGDWGAPGNVPGQTTAAWKEVILASVRLASE